MLKVETNNPEETFDLGKKIGESLTHGGIVCLQGDLGAGKTVLAKGICRGLGVEEEITSPTYTVANEYRGKLKVYHMDLYRIRDEEELYDIGFEDYLYRGEGVTIIEWPDKAGALMPDNYLDINLRGEGNWREIRIIPQANKFIELVAELK
ncbi:tRNA (adenosine(37)-N6)-threonylcarbamoyltransferase complex ATPase subunit type 1 TsaE [Natroniella acetigena]|uniref:tRNA (adenosine(37)-N6)-threonylcarbamoyltransferase complex ATPase subunit type 1 TsaE n=1 Tax=Natroniella acetigena TaxID=52004 RepID=UPI00200A3F15|nr:tRNA (adenosine(37)-N6)-threonylcarbamoyltransferase complex ATPase subunit type 1 TsaE [Natroniella acetigena]MCK8826169.1 tRNA (adenosine(37)-N6)-threonylcarbamoyltransferase complex ATPase subunit type 1 TsaE [Natroniella acetigena]